MDEIILARGHTVKLVLPDGHEVYITLNKASLDITVNSQIKIKPVAVNHVEIDFGAPLFKSLSVSPPPLPLSPALSEHSQSS